MNSGELAAKWDERYRHESVDASSPAEILTRHTALLPAAGQALDLACGLGANALFLARHGMAVDAWDLSEVAVDKLADYAIQQQLPVRACVRDVIANPPPPCSYDLIIVVRFLARELAPALVAALRPGGRLFYQTFGPSGPGPRNPAFRLCAGELVQLFQPLQLLAHEEAAGQETMLVAERGRSRDGCDSEL